VTRVSLGNWTEYLVYWSEITMDHLVPLSRPPGLVSIGRGRHAAGTTAEYLLPEHWCLHAYRWRGTVSVRGRELAVTPGSLHLTPPDHHLRYHYGPDVHHISAHFALRAGGPVWAVSGLQADRDDYPTLERQLEQAVAAFRANPVRAEALLWSVLWQLVAPGAVPEGETVDPRFVAACEWIDLRLGEEIAVPDLAAAVDLSHNQLTRLFRAHAGTTVVASIRDRRVERACHLLRHTTLPIAQIGAAVGIPDPQSFNKAFKKVQGRSPSAYRRTGPGHILYG